MFRRGSAARRRPQGFVDPCIPTLATKPPLGTRWIHDIKHDGYRLIARRDGDRVRLFTRRGYDWADRYPLIREAMLALPQDATMMARPWCAMRSALRILSSCTAGSMTASRFSTP